MPIYLLQAGEGGPVKIGYSMTHALPSRLAAIQANNHAPLRLLRVLQDGFNLERRLHMQFKHLRLHGEWFAFDEAMLGDLGTPGDANFATLEVELPREVGGAGHRRKAAA